MKRKIVKAVGAGILIGMMIANINCFAGEGQSDRWIGSGDKWQVSDGAGGVIKDCWFQDDVSGQWYLLGAEDGSVMYAGLVTDGSTGKTYLLNVEHDGTYGRMVTTDGTYNLNGRQVVLNFNQAHDGSFGAITRGLDEARSSGVVESKRDYIPVAGGDGSGGSSSLGQVQGTQQQVVDNQQQQQQAPAQQTGKGSFFDSQVTGEVVSSGGWYDMTPEQQAALVNSLKHGGVH